MIWCCLLGNEATAVAIRDLRFGLIVMFTHFIFIVAWLHWYFIKRFLLLSDTQQQVCQYYNDGHCRYGKRCRDLHVCKYFVKGHCRYGAACRLKHIPDSGRSSGQDARGRRSNGKKRRGHRERSSSSSSDGRSCLYFMCVQPTIQMSKSH